jgi:hypothetical protein
VVHLFFAVTLKIIQAFASSMPLVEHFLLSARSILKYRWIFEKLYGFDYDYAHAHEHEYLGDEMKLIDGQLLMC